VTHYEILGVPRDASSAEIERAYKAAARRLHPDRHGGAPEAEERMKELNAIRVTLTNRRLRAAYDARLAPKAAAPTRSAEVRPPPGFRPAEVRAAPIFRASDVRRPPIFRAPAFRAWKVRAPLDEQAPKAGAPPAFQTTDEANSLPRVMNRLWTGLFIGLPLSLLWGPMTRAELPRERTAFSIITGFFVAIVTAAVEVPFAPMLSSTFLGLIVTAPYAVVTDTYSSLAGGAVVGLGLGWLLHRADGHE